MFNFIHLLNFFGPIRDNVKIDWADLVPNLNGPKIALEHDQVIQLNCIDQSWKAEGLGHIPMKKRKKFDKLRQSLF